MDGWMDKWQIAFGSSSLAKKAKWITFGQGMKSKLINYKINYPFEAKSHSQYSKIYIYRYYYGPPLAITSCWDWGLWVGLCLGLASRQIRWQIPIYNQLTGNFCPASVIYFAFISVRFVLFYFMLLCCFCGWLNTIN